MHNKPHMAEPDPVIELPACLRRKRFLARIIITWERVWVALWPPLGVIGVFAITAMTGLWSYLPLFVHIGALSLFTGFLIVALWPLSRLSWPDKKQALRRLEKASKLEHRPLSSLFDTLGVGRSDAPARQLWSAHKQALKSSSRKLKTGWPSPGLIKRDPYALRSALLLLLVAAFFYAGPEWNTALVRAFNPAHGFVPNIITMDAWLKPPAYTARPPLFLARGNIAKDKPVNRQYKAPAGSELVIRLSGTDEPSLSSPQASNPGLGFSRKAKQVWESRQILQSTRRISVLAEGRNIVRWDFTIKPDAPPQIWLARKPEFTPNQVVKLTYDMRDDYGVKQAVARFRLQSTKQKGDKNPPLIKPPDFTLPVFANQNTQKPQIIYRDLTAHPWAGLVVELSLSARDEAGQETSSKPVLVRLPERIFTKALAKAVMEQRRMLALDPENRWIAATALDALSIAPARFIKKSRIYLGLRAAYRALHHMNDEKDLTQIINLLWEIALDIEGDDLNASARNLRQAQENLRRALAKGASDAEISKLMRELKKSLGQYLEAMRKKAARTPPGSVQQRLLNNKVIRPRDLSKMLEEMEKLAKSGARDAAREMLSKLQNLLENLKAAPGPHESREDAAMNKWMENLDKLMRDQQQLQEETFSSRKPEAGGKDKDGQLLSREDNKPPPDKKGEKQQSTEKRKSGQKSKNAEQQRKLEGRQKALRQALQGLNKQLGKMGMKAPNPFGRAGDAMKRAEKQLGKGRNGDAAGEQGKALDNLRSGMRSVARQIMRRLAKNAGGGPQGKDRADPLGRALPSDQLGSNEKMRKSGQSSAEEAYRIRNELKRRLGERSRPKPERQYLERLLRWF